MTEEILKKKLVLSKSDDRDLKNVVIDLIRHGFLELKLSSFPIPNDRKALCASRLDAGQHAD